MSRCPSLRSRHTASSSRTGDRILAGVYPDREPVVHGAVNVAPYRKRFAAWMKSRGPFGRQHKVPRIVTEGELFASLQLFAGDHR